MTFLELAFSHIARGLHVLPLKPRGKSPIVSGGCHAAAADESQIRAWWTKTPNANVGIGCGNSNKAVLDIDHGLSSLEDFQAWRMRNGLPETYTVRTGRRPEFGIQMYFEGAMPDVGEWKLDGCSGQVKSLGGLVVEAGSIHPSGETYEVISNLPFAPTPDVVRQLKTDRAVIERKPGEKITENRNNALCSEVSKFRHKVPGVTVDKTLAYFQQWNIEDVAAPMSMDEVEEVVRKQFRLYRDAEQLPQITVNGPKAEPVTVTDAPQPIGIYSIPEISFVGRTEDQLTDACVPFEVGVSRYRELARGAIVGDSYGVLKLLVSPSGGKLLGVHVFGTGATELIHIGQAVMGCGGTVDYLVNAVFNYPTLSEAYKVAALDATNKMRAVTRLSG